MMPTTNSEAEADLRCCSTRPGIWNLFTGSWLDIKIGIAKNKMEKVMSIIAKKTATTCIASPQVQTRPQIQFSARVKLGMGGCSALQARQTTRRIAVNLKRINSRCWIAEQLPCTRAKTLKVPRRQPRGT
jgi:hypothetical protein